MHHPAFKFLISLALGAVAALAGAPPHGNAAHANSVGNPGSGAWARVEMTRAELTAWLGPVDSVDYGSFQWLPADTLSRTRQLGPPPAQPATLVAQPFTLQLGGESFDPIDRPITTLAGHAAQDKNNPHTGWWLVQFAGPSKRSWLSDLSERELLPISYLHPFTYIVWGSETAILQLHAAAPPHVRAISEFRGSYKIPPTLRAGHDDAAQTRMIMLLTANAELGFWHAGDMGRLGGPIRAISQINSFLSVIYMMATGIRTPDLTALPGVYAVQDIPLDAGIRGELQNQVNVGHVDADGYAFPGYLRWLEGTGFDGRGVTVSVVDEIGFRQDHDDLIDNAFPCMDHGGSVSSCSRTTASSRHATHVAGAIAGTGATGIADHAGFLRGLGVAPGANVVSQDFLPLLGGDHGGMVPEGMTTIFREAARSGAILVNNSWGPSRTARGYDIPTQQVDFAVRDADPESDGGQPLLPVWAIMNGQGDDSGGACAPGSLGSPDEAKNLLAVGATYLMDDAGEQVPGLMNDLAWVSAHGNACDGRRVPHLVAPGCNTDNAVDSGVDGHSHGGNGRPGFNRLQPGFCGTSMAAPNVTGAAAVFVERHRALNGGATPSPALIKAALTGAASDLAGHRNANRTGAKVLGHRPDRFQGFGRLDLDAAVNARAHVLHFDQKHVLTESGTEWRHRVGVDDPDQPVRIMLAWTDAPGHGLGGNAPAWVNDLDLRVDADGQLFRGNVIGDDGWSATGGAPDGINNMEAVYLSPQQHGGRHLDLSVLASNIAADALNPRNPNLAEPRQDFALVCYNCIGDPATPASNTDLGVDFRYSTLTVRPGQRERVVLEAGNHAAASAHDARVLFELPEGVTHVRAAPSSTPAAWTCSGAGRQVRCQRDGAVAPTSSLGRITLTLHIDEDLPAGTLPLKARIWARHNTDPYPANDLAGMQLVVTTATQAEAIFADGFDRLD